MAKNPASKRPISRIGRAIDRAGKVAQQWFLYLNFRAIRSFEDVRKMPAEKGTVLMVSFTDWAPRLLLEGIVAAAFRARGYVPVMLTRRSHRWAERYFRACGVDDFVFFDERMRDAAKDVPEAEAMKLLDANHSFAGLFSLRWNDIGIGRHVLSTIVRQLLQGSVSFGDPAVDALLKKFLPESMRAGLAAHRLFDERKFDAVLFLEKGYTPYGELFDVAIERGCNVIQYHHAHRSDLLNMKRYNVANRFRHPTSLSQASWDKIKTMPWTTAEENAFMEDMRRGYADGTWFNRKLLLDGKKLKTPDEVRAQLHLDPTKKTIVVFSHILWDATFFFGTNLFEDYEKWLVATVRAACQNTAVNWVIKLHPDYTWKMRQGGTTITPRDAVALQSDIGQLPPHVQIVPPETDINTYSFFEVMDACVTVRGTIGIEAPCFGIPVLTAGTGRYDGLGFTDDSQTIEEYLAKLARIQDLPRLSPDRISLARRHADALFRYRPLPFPSCPLVPIKRPDGSTDHELRTPLTTAADIAKAQDLGTLVDWVTQSKEEDYLAPLPV